MKTIQLTDEQYQALLNGETVTIEPPKPMVEKWQPKGGEYFIGINGRIVEVDDDWTSEGPINFGMVYPTKESAEKARDAMRTHNRLLAWLAENDDGWVADWNDNVQAKCHVYLGCDPEEEVPYSFSINWECKDLSTVYMSEKNARKLCELLNKGVVEL